MLVPLNRKQKWIAYGSLVFVVFWTLLLLFMLGVYLFEGA
jgi:hypothetical protein